MRSCFILLLLLSFLGRAQTVVVVHRSDYRHNYAVGQFVYIEEAADTSKLRYIATLKVHKEDFAFTAVHLLGLMKTTAKDLGANTFRVQSYVENDSAVTLTVKTYFAPLNFFEANEKKIDTGGVYFFSAERVPGFRQKFNLNSALTEFESTRYLKYVPKNDQHVTVSGNSVIKTPRAFKHRSGKESRYFLVGQNMPNAAGIILAVGIFVGTQGFLIPYGKNYFKKNGVERLDYEFGRAMIDLYKEEKVD